MFVLDTRQYRSRNSDPDGPNKTMLGEAQRRWLIDALKKSDATWKVIATSVPLSNDRKSHPLIPGNDGWARAEDGTGFQEELSMIVRTILESRIPNVVWLSGDVHYVQGNAYDPDGDGTPDFHEFISGPLSASPGRLVSPAPALRPTSYFSETGFFNFGVVTVTSRLFRVDIVDGEGKVRYSHTLTAR
jgi:alkaline phosphatase D